MPATQTIEFRAVTGQTVTAKLFAAGSDTEVASVTATEATNRKGTYTATFTDVAAGEYQLLAFNATPIPVASWWVTLAATTATYEVYEKANRLAIADAVWDEPYSQHTTAGTFGKLMDILRKSNLTIDGTVSNAITPTTLTFSSNVSATTSAYAHAVLLFVSGPLEGENSPIISYDNTNGVFVLEEPLTAAPSDGDEFVVIAGSHVHAIADIQSGLATSSGVTSAFTEIKGATWSSSTDTLEAIRDASGTATVNVMPLSSTITPRVQGTRVTTFIGDLSACGPIAVNDSSSNPVNLTAQGTLQVIIERRDGTDYEVIPNGSLVISGASNNELTFTPGASSVANLGQHLWALRRTANGQVLAHGEFLVAPAAKSGT